MATGAWTWRPSSPFRAPWNTIRKWIATARTFPFRSLRPPRQYAKHVGRELKVTLDEGEPLVGTLSRSDDQGIVLEWTTREPKPVGKGKHTVLHTQSIPYGDIRKACVVLKF